MIEPSCLKRRLILATTAWCCALALPSAQAPDRQSVTPLSAAVAKADVAPGDVVHVTDKTGRTIKGKLAALTDDVVRVKIGADVRTVAAAEVRRIDWQQPDSPLTGVLIGAAVGAIPGIYWLVVDPNECAGLCAEEYALIAVGAVVGGVIDHAIKKTVTVYEANDGATTITVSPFVRRRGWGVLVAVKF